jgi:hypothetical protein
MTGESTSAKPVYPVIADADTSWRQGIISRERLIGARVIAATKMSSDGQLGHQNLSLGLGAQQHGDKEDGQPDYRGDEDWARKGDVVGGCV